MSAGVVRVPSHVRADGTTWTVERAWPDRTGVGVELGGVPEHPHRRAGHLDRAGGLTLLPAGSDPRLPSLAGVASHGAVISHRPGRRAVVRCATSPGTTFTKVVRPGRGEALARAAHEARALEPHVTLPRVLACGDDHLVLAGLPGRSLLDVAAEDAATWQGAWSGWAQAWTRVVDQVDPGCAGTLHDAAAEAEVLLGWQGKARPLLAPRHRVVLDAVVADAVARLLGGKPSRLAVCHRDLHDQQVLWHPVHGVGVLDVDTLARGEAALDLGNLRAHVDLRRRQGLLTSDQAAVARDRVDRVAQDLGVDRTRLLTHERAAAARLVCVYAFRPRWRTVAEALLRDLS